LIYYISQPRDNTCKIECKYWL